MFDAQGLFKLHINYIYNWPAERPRLEEVKEACEALLVVCHPDAEQALKEWRRVVEARWRVSEIDLRSLISDL